MSGRGRQSCWRPAKGGRAFCPGRHPHLLRLPGGDAVRHGDACRGATMRRLSRVAPAVTASLLVALAGLRTHRRGPRLSAMRIAAHASSPRSAAVPATRSRALRTRAAGSGRRSTKSATARSSPGMLPNTPENLVRLAARAAERRAGQRDAGYGTRTIMMRTTSPPISTRCADADRQAASLRGAARPGCRGSPCPAAGRSRRPRPRRSHRAPPPPPTAAAPKDDGQWTMPAKNYAATRYSELEPDQRRQR